MGIGREKDRSGSVCGTVDTHFTGKKEYSNVTEFNAMISYQTILNIIKTSTTVDVIKC